MLFRSRVITRGSNTICFDTYNGTFVYLDSFCNMAASDFTVGDNIEESLLSMNSIYPRVNGKDMHRYIYNKVCGDNSQKGSAIHHVSMLKYDNRFNNLSLLKSRQHCNEHTKRIYTYDKEEKVFTSTLGYSCKNEFELILSVANYYKHEDNYYKILEDSRYCQDDYFAYIAGLISRDELLVKKLKYLAQNPVIIYLYDLEGMCKENNVAIRNYKFDEEGFMISDKGFRYSDYLHIFLEAKFKYRNLQLPQDIKLDNDEDFLEFYYLHLKNCNLATEYLNYDKLYENYMFNTADRVMQGKASGLSIKEFNRRLKSFEENMVTQEAIKDLVSSAKQERYALEHATESIMLLVNSLSKQETPVFSPKEDTSDAQPCDDEEDSDFLEDIGFLEDNNSLQTFSDSSLDDLRTIVGDKLTEFINLLSGEGKEITPPTTTVSDSSDDFLSDL